ncbi:MAG TPA: AAA family ATPase [Candidatus Saccharimonadales bacterium]|nr:AAA family ATPase [Candidatus Saccharimonadales bacterium]
MPTTIQPTSSHTLTLPWVERVTQGFVFCDDMRVAVSLALAAGVNLIFSGPGGHAKSEFLETVFGAITGQETYVKSFGQGTGTEELFGGLDFDALNRAEGATLRYNPERSFLNHHIAVFEELFDAPPRVLTSLKDTLTAKELRNGHQRHPMTTRVIAAATNRSPQEIAEGGPEIEALIQRFPIQLEVKWSQYDKAAFIQLFSAVLGREDVESGAAWTDIEGLQLRTKSMTVSSGMRSMLAQILVELRKDHVPVSPRTAMVALLLTQAVAAINGRDRVIPADLKAIAYLPGALRLRQRVDELIIELGDSIDTEEKLDQAQRDIAALVTRLNVSSSPEELQDIASEANNLASRISVLRASADQIGRRRTLFESAKSIAAEANDAEGRKALNDAEASMQQLQDNLMQVNTLDQWRTFCGEIREFLAKLIALPVSGQHARERLNSLVNDAQALLQIADEELKKARLEASAGENGQRLEEIGVQIQRLARQLSRHNKTDQERASLLREVGEIESELSQMLVHTSLQTTYDAVMSKIRVIRLNNSRTHRV